MELQRYLKAPSRSDEISQRFLQAVGKRFTMGVHQPVSSFIIPMEHLADILKCFSDFLGRSACAAVLFHLGKEVGRIYFERFREEKVHLDGGRFSCNSIDHMTYIPLLKDITLDERNRKGSITVRISDNRSFDHAIIHLLSYYLKGFLKGYLERSLNSELKIISERYLDAKRSGGRLKVSFIEITFSF
ncbi:MAG: hypothetical protein DRO46_02160 [Candidatus Hecatellales archaeon]|nr:MAG: hypothetical protein DRO46_02160 [Candidatus Hecatellales archaeon]